MLAFAFVTDVVFGAALSYAAWSSEPPSPTRRAGGPATGAGSRTDATGASPGFGGPGGDRTRDLRLARAALSQLSYRAVLDPLSRRQGMGFRDMAARVVKAAYVESFDVDIGHYMDHPETGEPLEFALSIYSNADDDSDFEIWDVEQRDDARPGWSQDWKVEDFLAILPEKELKELKQEAVSLAKSKEFEAEDRLYRGQW